MWKHEKITSAYLQRIVISGAGWYEKNNLDVIGKMIPVAFWIEWLFDFTPTKSPPDIQLLLPDCSM